MRNARALAVEETGRRCLGVDMMLDGAGFRGGSERLHADIAIDNRCETGCGPIAATSRNDLR
ncbi:MAG TPA: hypothetical protein VFS23_24330 [Vicinamibacterales bacterium]|nr:hypothetical protein [Vicinamibacterales bacterium]